MILVTNNLAKYDQSFSIVQEKDAQLKTATMELDYKTGK